MFPLPITGFMSIGTDFLAQLSVKQGQNMFVMGVNKRAAYNCNDLGQGKENHSKKLLGGLSG